MTASPNFPLSSKKDHAALSLGDLLMVLPTLSAVPKYTHFFLLVKQRAVLLFKVNRTEWIPVLGRVTGAVVTRPWAPGRQSPWQPAWRRGNPDNPAVSFPAEVSRWLSPPRNKPHSVLLSLRKF